MDIIPLAMAHSRDARQNATAEDVVSVSPIPADINIASATLSCGSIHTCVVRSSRANVATRKKLNDTMQNSRALWHARLVPWRRSR